MEENKGFKNRLEAFFGGKGFYIVLFVCLAVVGVSAWALMFAGDEPASTEDFGKDYVSVMAGDDTPAKSDIPNNSADAAVKPDVSRPDNTPVVTPEDTKPDSAVNVDVTDKEKDAAKAEDAEETVTKKPEEQEPVFIWPVSGTVAVEYSPDTLIYNKTMADWRTHDGVDIAAQIGVKVLAAASGKVERVYADDLFGTTVIIDHGKDIKSIYSNLAATPTVKEGDAVTVGSVIGAVGDTALGETGEVAHLHFAMTKAGAPADPADYLPRK